MTNIKSRFKPQVERALEGQGMTSEAIAEYKDKNWTYFLRNCRRLVPEPKRLLERFNSVIEMFGNVVDAKSGEKLLRSDAMKAVNLLRKHIQTGCLSDPEGVPLYYPTGQNAAGITTHRCVRGTNCTEVPFFVARRVHIISGVASQPAVLASLLITSSSAVLVFTQLLTWSVSSPIRRTALQGLSPLPSQATVIVLCISCTGPFCSPRVQLPLERQDGCEEPRPTKGGWRVLRPV